MLKPVTRNLYPDFPKLREIADFLSVLAVDHESSLLKCHDTLPAILTLHDIVLINLSSLDIQEAGKLSDRLSIYPIPFIAVLIDEDMSLRPWISVSSPLQEKTIQPDRPRFSAENLELFQPAELDFALRHKDTPN